MFQAGLYAIRPASPDDAEALRRLAQLDSQQPLSGDVLVGELHGEIAAALSLEDDRIIADPFVRTGHVLALLRVRSASLRAAEREPSIRDRIRAAVPIRRNARAPAVVRTHG